MRCNALHLQRSEKISTPFARDGINGTDIGSVRGGRLSSHRRTHTIIFLSPVTPTADAPLSLFPFAFHALLPSTFIPIPLLLLLPNNKTPASAALWGKDEGKGERVVVVVGEGVAAETRAGARQNGQEQEVITESRARGGDAHVIWVEM